MEITQEQIIEAIGKNPGLVKGIMPTIIETEEGKKVVEAKAEITYKANIGEEIKKVHDLYDANVFEILGVRPGSKDGGKQKTYDFIKELLVEFKGLKDIKDTLSKDAKVIELENKVKTLTENGGGKHVQEIFDQAKLAWEKEKSEYEEKVKSLQSNGEEFQKRTAIQSAIQMIKFNPDTPDSIKTMVLKNVEEDLIKNSKLEDGKLVFLDKEGKAQIGATYQPKTALEVLSGLDAIKDISLKDKEKTGGGADEVITGSIKTVKVEGKDEVKKLVLEEGSFKTRSEFVQVANKALSDAGITNRDPDFARMKDEAYKELKVADLPA